MSAYKILYYNILYTPVPIYRNLATVNSPLLINIVVIILYIIIVINIVTYTFLIVLSFLIKYSFRENIISYYYILSISLLSQNTKLFRDNDNKFVFYDCSHGVKSRIRVYIIYYEYNVRHNPALSEIGQWRIKDYLFFPVLKKLINTLCDFDFFVFYVIR